MVLLVKTTAKVDQKLLALSAQEFVELDTTLSNLSKVSIMGMAQGHYIAVIDTTYDVYVLEPAYPGPDALVVYDSKEVVVVDLLIPKGQPMSTPRKHQLAVDAASALCLFAPRFYIR